MGTNSGESGARNPEARVSEAEQKCGKVCKVEDLKNNLEITYNKLGHTHNKTVKMRVS